MAPTAAIPWLALACLVVATAPGRAAPGPFIDYLTVEANEGGSSGGHAALRVGEWVHHFQNRDGLLLLARQTPERFLATYALLGNRTVRASRISVTAQTAALLEAHFGERYRVQQRQLDRRDSLREERELLEMLSEIERGRIREPDALASLRLRGAGAFLPRSAGDASQDPALAALRRRVVAKRGADFLEESIRTLLREIAALRPDPPDDSGVEPATPLRDSFARRLRDRLQLVVALRVLNEALPLRADGRFSPAGPAWRVGRRESRRLRTGSRELGDQLMRLLDSKRPDRGLPLLVGMARLAALDATIRGGRWVWLDSFDENDERIELARIENADAILSGLADETRGSLDDRHTRFLAGERWDEAAYAELEAAANRHAEVQRAQAGASHLRVQRFGRVPTRSAAPSDGALPRLEGAALAAALGPARAAERNAEQRLRKAYRYHLIRRNCVSEIFASLNAAFPGGRAESVERLGGSHQAWGLGVIPFVSHRSVNRRYRVERVIEIPSAREARIAALVERESHLAVWLRESNTLTATTYERGSRDSQFVLFGDGVGPARPLVGAVNLAAAVVETGVGLVALPVRGTGTFRSGLRGTLSSLAELVFLNVRKGSYDYVSIEQRRRVAAALGPLH